MLKGLISQFERGTVTEDAIASVYAGCKNHASRKLLQKFKATKHEN